MLKEIFKELVKEKDLVDRNYEDIIIEFDIDKNFLSSVKFDYENQYELRNLGIDSEKFKFELTLRNLVYLRQQYKGIDSSIIQNNQKLIENPIYVFCGIYDVREDCYGPIIGEYEDYFYGIYENVCNNIYNKDTKEIPKMNIAEFEKDKSIIHSGGYVTYYEVKVIFEEELLNTKSLNDCVKETQNRIDELSYIRSPE